MYKNHQKKIQNSNLFKDRHRKKLIKNKKKSVLYFYHQSTLRKEPLFLQIVTKKDRFSKNKGKNSIT